MFLISPFGRIGRGQWWLGALASFLIGFVGIFITILVTGPHVPTASFPSDAIWGIALSLLMSFYVNVCTSITRLHDRGKSGFLFFIALIPTYGWVWQIITCGILPGDYHENEYGECNGGGFDISDEIETLANRGQPKPAFDPKSSFTPPVGNAQPSPSFGQAPKPMFGSR